MKKAIIIYQSKKGTTKQLGGEISSFLEIKGIQTEVISAEQNKTLELSNYDYIFLGCWTNGLMIFAQHPDKIWKRFVKSLDIPVTSKVFLFTTYKIATGTMFSKMRKYLPNSEQSPILEIKSRNGTLSNENAYLMEQKIS